jgi:hypothetical protein
MKKLIAAIAIFAGVLLTGCTPEQIAWWNDPNVPQETKDTVRRAMIERSQPQDCYQAIDAHWPGDKTWARTIVWRESRNIPSARNASGASGCFQMMMPLHQARFTAVGCSPSAWANPSCNTKAAWHLFQAAGRSPWVLTDY